MGATGSRDEQDHNSNNNNNVSKTGISFSKDIIDFGANGPCTLNEHLVETFTITNSKEKKIQI